MKPHRQLRGDVGDDDVIQFDYHIYTNRFIDITHFFDIWPGTDDDNYHFVPEKQTPGTIVRVTGLWRIFTRDEETNNTTNVVIPPEVYKDVVRELVNEWPRMIAIRDNALVHLDDSDSDSVSSQSGTETASVESSPTRKAKLESPAPAAPAIEIVISHEDCDGRFFKKTRPDAHGRRVTVCFHCENAPPSRWREMYTHFNFDFVCVACADKYDRA